MSSATLQPTKQWSSTAPSTVSLIERLGFWSPLACATPGQCAIQLLAPTSLWPGSRSSTLRIGLPPVGADAVTTPAGDMGMVGGSGPRASRRAQRAVDQQQVGALAEQPLPL